MCMYVICIYIYILGRTIYLKWPRTKFLMPCVCLLSPLSLVQMFTAMSDCVCLSSLSRSLLSLGNHTTKPIRTAVKMESAKTLTGLSEVPLWIKCMGFDIWAVCHPLGLIPEQCWTCKLDPAHDLNLVCSCTHRSCRLCGQITHLDHVPHLEWWRKWKWELWPVRLQTFLFHLN